MLKKYFGDAAFYRRVFVLMIPIMLQNGITNFVNMLDNIMIGQVGNAEMTGVAVTNQLLFVFNLCIFGAVSGAGIFVAQFFGSGNSEGVRRTFRFKLVFCFLLGVLGIAIFSLFDDFLIGAYLKGEGDIADIEASLSYAKEYLSIMLIGLIPYTIVQSYSSTLRETYRAFPPMLAGIFAVLVNLVLNYILIFGNFGAPELGVKGAAIATVISRFAELFIILVWAKIDKTLAPFAKGALRHFYIPRSLVVNIIKKGMPLMLNEVMWASGIAILNQCYSLRGFEVVTATNIQSTFFNVFSVAFMAVGVAAGIILGQSLGAGEEKHAMETAKKLIVLSIMISFIVGALYFAASGIIPHIYKTTDSTKALATSMICIVALAMPLDAFAHVCYFILRSGGKIIVTMLFDSLFVWLLVLPIAFLLSRYTDVHILVLFSICQFINIIKDILGYLFVSKGIWIKNIVKDS